MRHLRQFLEREDGPTATEYALILALLILTCISGIQCIGRGVTRVYDRSSSALTHTVQRE
jgi:pilus assembly protein Flp/PilA